MRRKMVKRHCSRMTMFENGKFAKPNCIMAKERNPSLRLTQLHISPSFLSIHLRCIYIHYTKIEIRSCLLIYGALCSMAFEEDMGLAESIQHQVGLLAVAGELHF
jgi:hypothetical protein